LVAAGALAVSLSVGVAVSGLDMKPHNYLLVLLAPALVMRRARRYLLDFVPFAVLIVLYAQCRGIAHNLRPDPFYAPQLDAEKLLFGGAVPSAELQDWLWTGTKQWYDHAAYVVTRLHFIVPPLLAFVLWVRRRALFYRFAATIVALSYVGALTFLLFPAAPPWAAAEKGLLDVRKLPLDDLVPSATAGGLVDPNPYAAIPSLHAGYAFLCFLFVVVTLWRTRWRWWAIGLGAIYPLAESAAVVYTANHYVVDLVIGIAYAAAALAAVTWFWRRRGWPE
jgi:membrane-associated phospholipid phosphatase